MQAAKIWFSYKLLKKDLFFPRNVPITTSTLTMFLCLLLETNVMEAMKMSFLFLQILLRGNSYSIAVNWLTLCLKICGNSLLDLPTATTCLCLKLQPKMMTNVTMWRQYFSHWPIRSMQTNFYSKAEKNWKVLPLFKSPQLHQLKKNLDTVVFKLFCCDKYWDLFLI